MSYFKFYISYTTFILWYVKYLVKIKIQRCIKLNMSTYAETYCYLRSYQAAHGRIFYYALDIWLEILTIFTFLLMIILVFLQMITRIYILRYVFIVWYIDCLISFHLVIIKSLYISRENIVKCLPGHRYLIKYECRQS